LERGSFCQLTGKDYWKLICEFQPKPIWVQVHHLVTPCSNIILVKFRWCPFPSYILTFICTWKHKAPPHTEACICRLMSLPLPRIHLHTFGPLNIKKSLCNAWERPAKTRHHLHDHAPQIKLREAPVESWPSHRLECDNELMPSHFLACKTTFFLTSKGFTNYGYWFSFF